MVRGGWGGKEVSFRVLLFRSISFGRVVRQEKLKLKQKVKPNEGKKEIV